MRINKFIAQAGYTSRRKADDLIAAEKVKVNGKILKEMGYNVKDDDIISIDGKILQLEEYFYYKLNKPVGYITSNYDPHNEKDLNNLIDIDERFFAAGRLDKDSHGLLIITNDGDFTNALIHPSSGISKEYIVKVDKILNDKQIEKFKSGLDIGNGEMTSDAAIRYIKNNTYIVTIRQGYNRQIRRMFAVLGSTVIGLKRTRIGAIHLNDLIAGKYKKFDKKEMEFVSLMKE
ncbi:pseudouridine synthase [Anaerococcus octavius]|uniref:pseudouridine synthase n=1 Tax=Anaerococcus octavius TaxID=54007 RepID=UPI0027B904E1|nr:pseudouridine synthase [Anaerococcus octavius]MDU5229199.1 pseudouridine synthase [Anaerococcus sp.]